MLVLVAKPHHLVFFVLLTITSPVIMGNVKIEVVNISFNFELF